MPVDGRLVATPRPPPRRSLNSTREIALLRDLYARRDAAGWGHCGNLAV